MDFKHPHVICCPDKQDTVLVSNPNNLSGDKIRVAKWLIQIPITELHQDLLSTGDQGFKLCRNEHNDVIISDTALRALMPKRIRPMSDRYKEMCCCTICITMQLHQNNLNRFRITFLAYLKKQMNTIPSEREEEKKAAETRYRTYKSAVLLGGEPLHQKVKHAVAEIHCPPPIPFDKDSLPRYNCAKGWCTKFPTYK